MRAEPGAKPGPNQMIAAGNQRTVCLIATGLPIMGPHSHRPGVLPFHVLFSRGMVGNGNLTLGDNMTYYLKEFFTPRATAHSDRFRNYGVREYEWKIKELTAKIEHLQNQLLSNKEELDALKRYTRDQSAFEKFFWGN